ncbi:putative ribonuclease H-like domain-containing protein [Tanacetum coccineum]
MVEKPVLNNKGRVTGQREIRPVWNNAQRVNHQNKFTHPHPKRNFVPTAVVTKSGQVPVNTAKQSSPRAAASISTARPVNTATPKPKDMEKMLLSPQHTGFGDQQEMLLTIPPKTVDHICLKDLTILIYKADSRSRNFDSGCSRHMTRNRSFLIDYQEIDGGFVAFGGSPKRRCDNETEFKNKIMNEFCEMKGIRREFSVARTPQQNGVAERKNKTLIEAARTMLADSKLPTTFWAKAVNTA